MIRQYPAGGGHDQSRSVLDGPMDRTGWAMRLQITGGLNIRGAAGSVWDARRVVPWSCSIAWRPSASMHPVRSLCDGIRLSLIPHDSTRTPATRSSPCSHPCVRAHRSISSCTIRHGPRTSRRMRSLACSRIGHGSRGYERPDAWVRRIAIRMAVVASPWTRSAVLDPLTAPAACGWHRNPANPDVADAVRLLPRAQRAAVALFYYEDRPVAEICIHPRLHRIDRSRPSSSRPCNAWPKLLGEEV